MRAISRRQFGGALIGAGGLAAAGRLAGAPAILSGPAPQVAFGVASGDVGHEEAVVWARADRAARMVVEWSPHADFSGARRVVGPVTGAEADFTAKALLRGLPPGSTVRYRVRFEDSQGAAGEPAEGVLRTAARGPERVRFAWSGDTCGQGFGIDPAHGGLLTYESIRRVEPQFFVHSGDTIYADNPLEAEFRTAGGGVWRNLVTEEKSRRAETLADFRGNYRYALHDAHVRRLLAEVPVFAQWDDHEVLNNWYPGERLDADSDYKARTVDLLAERSRRAFFEYMPLRPDAGGRIHRRIRRGPLCDLFFLDLRSFRGPNSRNRQPLRGPEADFMGPAQLAWLREELVASRATWKFICSDMPLGLLVPDGPDAFEAFANGDGIPLGRELEVASLLRSLRGHGVRNVVWLTADVHYCASHHYDPARARFTDFYPFWEFVSGPLHAGTFGPGVLDDTFGPEVRFSSRGPGAPPSGPWTKDQFFGVVDIDPATRAATVSHHDREGGKLWSIELPAVGT